MTPLNISAHPDFPEVLMLEDVNGARLFYLSKGLELHGPGRVVQAYTPDMKFKAAFFQHLGAWDLPPVLLGVTENPL